ncbi:hypothetical protein, partial [Aeromonas taiwanensis]|uniref:hypothetical protein n=1 Tax=Aeromonas taiwanensis TaxID=633417 RepID=UPI001ADD726E
RITPFPPSCVRQALAGERLRDGGANKDIPTAQQIRCTSKKELLGQKSHNGNPKHKPPRAVA